MLPVAHVRRAVQASAEPGRRRAQSGESLVEIMVAVVIMGTAMVALLGSISTMIMATATHRGQVASGNQATYVAELIQNAPYVSCAGSTSYASSYGSGRYSLPSGFTLSVSQPRYLTSRGGHTVAPPYTPTFHSNQGACVSAGDQGAQEITVTVRAGSSGNRMSSKVTIVKRDNRRDGP